MDERLLWTLLRIIVNIMNELTQITELDNNANNLPHVQNYAIYVYRFTHPATSQAPHTHIFTSNKT